MQYREKLLELIFNQDKDAYIKWLDQQPLILQPDIFREFKQLSQELLKEANIDTVNEALKQMDEITNKYEEAIMDEQLAAVKADMATQEIDEHLAQLDKTMDEMRKYIIECIITNADNAPQMRELATHIINIEKEAGAYNPSNWKAIL